MRLPQLRFWVSCVLCAVLVYGLLVHHSLLHVPRPRSALLSLTRHGAQNRDAQSEEEHVDTNYQRWYHKLLAENKPNIDHGLNSSQVSNKTQLDLSSGNASGSVHKPNSTQEEGVDQAPSLPRILCWVMCDPDDLDRRVRHVRDTWAKHCDVTLFMSSATNTSFPTIGLDVPSGRNHIGVKSRSAWTYVYEHHVQHADYFVKADPDTFLIVPNLKLYLARRDPEAAECFGHNLWLRKSRTARYNSGGPGQVLSRGALTLMVTKAFTMGAGKHHCMPDGQGEDYKTALCLELVNGSIVDTRDQQGRETFMIFPSNHYFKPNFPEWYVTMDANGALKGKDCCSSVPISFHYVSPDNMHALYYFFYDVYRFPRLNEAISFIQPKSYGRR